MERKTSDAARQKILDDHRLIGQLTSEIASLADAQEMQSCVTRLLPVLQHHFADEEQEIDGLHADIRKRTPEQHSALLGLRQEHHELLERARQLLSAANEIHGVDVRLQQLGRHLREQLAAHEAKETHLFMDSIWTDFGEGD